MTLPLQNRHTRPPPLTQSHTIPNQRHPWPCRNMGQAVGRGKHRYLLCDAILRGVDCHELGVFIVLLSTGRGPTVDHHLRRKTPLRGCFGTCRFAVGKSIFSKQPPIILLRALKCILHITTAKSVFLLNKTPI